MSKNDTLSNSLKTYNNILPDALFKDIVRYKCISSILVKLCIEEYQNMECIDIARLMDGKIITNNDELMQSEMVLKPTELGTGFELNTRNDIVFDIKSNKSGNNNVNLVTVNFEMQQKTSLKLLKYDLIQRAIYYCASLLRDVSKKGDSYANLHKVYSIWFCAENVDIVRYPEIKDRYIHRYKIGRRYTDLNKVAFDENADLMEVVIVELPGLMKKVNNTEIENAVRKLFYDSKNSFEALETVTKVNLTKFKRRIDDMVDKEQFGKEQKAEGEEKMLRKLVNNYVQVKLNYGKTKEEAIKLAANELGVKYEDIVRVLE